jgi:putative ABC transport system permease protein
MHDVRIALRGFLRNPTFSVTAVLILGIGIGMAVAMWGVFSAVLLRPLPIFAQDEVVVPRTRDAAGVDLPFTPAEIQDLQRDSRTMRQVAGFAHYGSYTFPLADGDQALVLHQAAVTADFFSLLGARPVIGRLLQPSDDSTAHVMVLSYRAWQRQFAGDPAVIGHRLRFTRATWSYAIVGVAPPGLDYPVGADCWVPLSAGQRDLDLIARLRPGTTPAVARADFSTLAKAIDARRAGSGLNVARVDVRTLRTAIVGDARPVIVVLTGAVLLLLLIACVNVGNLLLLRAAARSRELATRRAIGATSRDILRQLTVESAVLAAMGGAIGLACAEAALRALRALAPPELPRIDAVGLGVAPFLAGLALTAVVTLVCGVAPSMQVVQLDLRTGKSLTRERRRVRQLLVASQVALALMMLTGAALLVRSLQRLEHLDLGYRADHLTLVELTLPSTRLRFTEPTKSFGVYDEVAPAIAALPGVTSMTPVILPPFIGTNVMAGIMEAEGQSAEEVRHNPLTPLEVGGPDYFRTLGVTLERGRGFLPSDREDGSPVVVVSQAASRYFWPGIDPLGKRIRFEGDSVWRTVVGVAHDLHFRAMREGSPTIFFPWRQFWWTGNIAVRTATDASTLAPEIRDLLSRTDPQVTLWRVRTMNDHLAGPLAQPRLSTALLSGFGLVALFLAAIGLYGIMASAVREQIRDIGVRMALGATPARVRVDVLRGAMLVALGGALVGTAGALAASRFLRSLLFEVSPTDPIALLGACAVLLGVAGIAAYVPAYQASCVDPARVLQGE